MQNKQINYPNYILTVIYFTRENKHPQLYRIHINHLVDKIDLSFKQTKPRKENNKKNPPPFPKKQHKTSPLKPNLVAQLRYH